MVALRSLYDHVTAVARPLQSGNIDAARLAVAQIVGRDPATLDEAGIARAAIESLAENASDGIVAPVFWGVLFGLPGIVGYKAINTLDSMIGHRSERHLYFGWAAARIDDIANFIPARLTGLLFTLVSSRFSQALSCMVRDANRHRSINAGWPEAAMAGALCCADQRTAQLPWRRDRRTLAERGCARPARCRRPFGLNALHPRDAAPRRIARRRWHLHEGWRCWNMAAISIRRCSVSADAWRMDRPVDQVSIGNPIRSARLSRIFGAFCHRGPMLNLCIRRRGRPMRPVRRFWRWLARRRRFNCCRVLLPRGQAHILAPTYNEYASVLSAAGWDVAWVPTLHALAGADLAVVVNPNNPDGRSYAKKDLLALLPRVGRLPR